MVKTVIREVVEAKYKADKTIAPGLLRIFFHTTILCNYETKQLPQHILKNDSLAS